MMASGDHTVTTAAMRADVVCCRMMCMMSADVVMTSTKPKIQGRSVVITRIGIWYWRFYVLIVG